MKEAVVASLPNVEHLRLASSLGCDLATDTADITLIHASRLHRTRKTGDGVDFSFGPNLQPRKNLRLLEKQKKMEIMEFGTEHHDLCLLSTCSYS